MENELITLQTVPPWLWKNGEVSVFTSIKKASGQSPWQHTAWQVDIRVGLVGSDLLIFWSPHQRLKYQVVLAAINHVAMLYIMLSTWHKASHIFPWIFSLPLQCFWSDGLNSHKKKTRGMETQPPIPHCCALTRCGRCLIYWSAVTRADEGPPRGTAAH